MRRPDQHDRSHARLLRALADARGEVYGLRVDSLSTVYRTAADILAPDVETCTHPIDQRLITTQKSYLETYSNQYTTCGRCFGINKAGRWVESP